MESIYVRPENKLVLFRPKKMGISKPGVTDPPTKLITFVRSFCRIRVCRACCGDVESLPEIFSKKHFRSVQEENYSNAFFTENNHCNKMR